MAGEGLKFEGVDKKYLEMLQILKKASREEK